MVKRALISDIHANLESLEAVLEDIRQQGVEEIYCLGDIVGYGPNPVECVDLVRRHCRKTIMGNHDQGALFDPEGFNAVAEQAIFWTRDQLERPVGSSQQMAERWDFLGELPLRIEEDGVLYVHGSPRNPLNEYVFPDDIYNPKKLERLFSLFPRLCFHGHTHVPGVFTPRPEFFSPEDVEYEFPLGQEKLMVNVGSVGQPRDGDARACYVILEEDRIRFRRVEYPVEKTIEKIYAIPELDNSLGDRLRLGH